MVVNTPSQTYQINCLVGWGVLLTRQSDQHQWLAWNGKGFPAIFEKCSEAQKFKKELKQHGCKYGKVVKVKTKYEYFS